MRTNIKKALAVLMTMVMLCGLLPLGALTASAADNLVSNGTFESGTSGWACSSGATMTATTTDPGSGSQSLALDCSTVDYCWTYVKISVTADTDYTISFKAKVTSNYININFLNTSWGSSGINKISVGNPSSWTEYSYEFNSGSNTALLVFFQSGWAMTTGGMIYLDDVVIAEVETDSGDSGDSGDEGDSTVTGENLIVNGSFEDGSNGWTLGSAGSVVSGGQEGDYALQMSNPTTQYSAIATQYVTVEPGAAYTFTWYCKRVSGTGVFNIYLDGATYSGQQNWMNETSGEWVQYTLNITINATTTSLLVKFSNEAASTVGTVLIDNVVLTKDPVASFDGFITNGDFEVGDMTGWTVSQTATASADAAYSGNYGAHITNPGAQYGGMISQGTVNVVAGNTYTISFWMKVTVGYVNIQIKDGSLSGTNLTSGGYNTATWKQFSYTVTPTTNVMYINFCGGGTGTVDEAYVDDFLVVEEKDPSFDGYLYNGDFETGNLDKWTYYHDTAVSTAAAYTGNYGVHLQGDGSWGGIMYQSTVNVKAGKTYIVSYYIKVLANGMNLQIKDGTTSSGTTLASKSHSASNFGSWTLVTHEVTPSQDGLFINFCGIGSSSSANASLAESAYVDDITVSLKGGEIYPEELIKFGGASVRDVEVSSTGGTGYGLAFKFEVEATSAQKDYENKYVESSGSVLLGETEYTLVRMGAVMTNQASVGQSSADFTLDSVNGTKIIDIPAVYLAGLTTEDVSFAVRILDIPQNHIGTSIYARPYYVYTENGEEVIVYGDIKSNTYAKVSNPKSSIKILSIGHSFSKDVMQTYLWNMFNEGGYEEIVIGYLYMGGCSMPKHLYNIQNNLAQYEYGKNSTGTWETSYNVSALTALQDEEWDYVNIQSSPDYIGGQTISSFKLGVNSDGDQITLDTPMTEYECITPITEWIQENALNTAVKTDYHMIWAYSEDCELWSYAYHNNNQLTMYNNIITQTLTNVVPHDGINDIIPCGTSIQNGRTSFIGDNFNEPVVTGTQADGYHLNSKYGDYTGALTWYCHYSGDDANVMAGYTGDLSANEFAAIAEAVNNAIENPYEITTSSYTE